MLFSIYIFRYVSRIDYFYGVYYKNDLKNLILLHFMRTRTIKFRRYMISAKLTPFRTLILNYSIELNFELLVRFKFYK